MNSLVLIAFLFWGGFAPQQTAPPASSGSGTQQPQPQPKKPPKKPAINPSETGGARGFAITLRGTVMDPAENAVAGAAIRLSSAASPQEQWETATDANGRFEFKAPRAGVYVLDVAKPGFQSARLPGLKLDTLLCSVRTHLEPGDARRVATVPFVDLRGQVRDGDGNPVEGAQLEFLRGGSARPVIVATDEEGDFRIPNVEAGSYHLRISATGFQVYERSSLAVTTEKDKPIVLRFELQK